MTTTDDRGEGGRGAHILHITFTQGYISTRGVHNNDFGTTDYSTDSIDNIE